MGIGWRNKKRLNKKLRKKEGRRNKQKRK